MTPRDIEQMIFNHAREAIIEYNTRVDKIVKDLDVYLEKKLSSALKVMDAVKDDLLSMDERLQKKIEDSFSKVLAHAVDSAKQHVVAAISQLVAEFAQKHVKNHVKAFLGDLLELEDVAA